MAFLFCPGSSFSKKPKFFRPRRKSLPTTQHRPDPPAKPSQLVDRQENNLHSSRQILCSVSDLASRSPTFSDGGDSGFGFRSQQSSASSGESGGHALPPSCFPAQSGYATDDNPSFESKLLQRATPSSPANLKMTVIRDYTPCCNEELAVRKGQRVKVLYRRNDWAFAVTKNGAHGYIPYSYCRLSRRYSYARTDVEESGNETDSTILGPEEGSRPFAYSRRHQSQHHLNGYVSCSESFPAPQHFRRSPVYVLPADCKPRMAPFYKECIEELVVIHDYMGREENELMVAKGERVKVLNADDQEWLWVSTIPGDEGFVPRSCLSFGTHPALQRCETNRQAQLRRCVSTERLKQKASMAARSHHHHHHHHHHNNSRHPIPRVNVNKHQAKERFKQLAIAKQQRPIVNNNKEEIKKIGSQLIVLADYDAHEMDELSVQLADLLLADMIPQSNADKLWAYNTRTDKLGFIPTSLVQPPVV